MLSNKIVYIAFIAFFLIPRVLAAPIIYAFSSGILPSETQEYVYRGFLMGLSNYDGISIDKDLKLIYSNSGSMTSPLEIAREVLKENPSIITGFPSSFESQLAAPILRDSGVLTFFASSSNLSLEKMGPNIFSSSENILQTNTQIAEEIHKKFNMSPGVVIYNPFDYFSELQKSTWKMILESKKISINLKFIPTAQDGKIPENLKNEFKSFKYVITTLFPSKSYEFFRFFDENKIDHPIYTNSSWHKMEFKLLERFFAKKSASVYLVYFKDNEPKIKEKIILEYKKKYKSNPSAEVFVGYDLGNIIGSIVKTSRDLKITTKEVMKASPCFSGSPFGKACFMNTGGFANRNIMLVNINERK